MTLTITRNDDVAQEQHICPEDQLTSMLAEVVARDSAGVRLAIAELDRKLHRGECYKVEEQFLGVKVGTSKEPQP